MDNRTKKSAIDRLKSRFNLYTGKTKGTETDIVAPGYKKDSGSMGKIEFPSTIEKAFQFFTDNYFQIASDTFGDEQKRLNLYKDLDLMAYNDGIMNLAVQTYADETVQCDEQDKPIEIKAKKKPMEKHFYEWASKLGLNKNKLTSTSWDLTLYGDAYFIPSIDYALGVTDISITSVYTVSDIIDFNGVKIIEKLKQKYGTALTTMIQKNKSLSSLADLLSKEALEENYGMYFKSYLMGYVLSKEMVLPPWQVIHMKRETSDINFYPFGRPLLLGVLAKYQSFKSSELLVDIARAMSMPKEIWTIKGSETMTDVELYQKVNQVRQMLENITSATKNPDLVSVGEPIYTVEDLFDYKVQSVDYDFDKLGDLEHKWEDVIIGTGIPKGYLFPNDGAFGNSAQSLLEQSKMFARRIYENQSAILEGIMTLYKIHLSITGDFDPDEDEFELFMHIPVVELSKDRQDFKTDSLNMAKEIISSLATASGIEEENMPPEVAMDILSKFSFLSTDDLETWYNNILTKKEEMAKEEESAMGDSGDEGVDDEFEENKKKVDVRRILKERKLSESILTEAYFNAKSKLFLTEGLHNGQHFVTSRKQENKTMESFKKHLAMDFRRRRKKV
jgi:hypothetical protein